MWNGLGRGMRTTGGAGRAEGGAAPKLSAVFLFTLPSNPRSAVQRWHSSVHVHIPDLYEMVNWWWKRPRAPSRLADRRESRFLLDRTVRKEAGAS